MLCVMDKNVIVKLKEKTCASVWMFSHSFGSGVTDRQTAACALELSKRALACPGEKRLKVRGEAGA